MEVSKEFKLGLLAVIGLVLVLLGINFLKTGLGFGRSNEYYALFDNGTGLKPENEVQLNGVKIGEVLEVGLLPKNPTLILAKFSVDEDNLNIPSSSEAWLISTDMLGTKCIDLRIDYSDTASTVMLKDGDTLNAKKETTLEEEFKRHLDPLRNKTEKLISRVEDIIVDINELWDSSASYTFEESVYKAREAIGTYRQLVTNLIDLINRETKVVSSIATNVTTVKDSVLMKMNALNAISTNVTAVKGDFSQSGLILDIANLNTGMVELNALLKRVDNGEGTLGALTKTDDFQQAMKATEQSMDLLLEDLTADPMKYIGLSILGKKIEGLKLTPEEEQILKDWLAR